MANRASLFSFFKSLKCTESGDGPARDHHHVHRDQGATDLVPEEALKTDHSCQNCGGVMVRQSGGNTADGDSGNPMTEKTSQTNTENAVTKDGRGDRDYPGHSRTLGVIGKGGMS